MLKNAHPLQTFFVGQFCFEHVKIYTELYFFVQRSLALELLLSKTDINLISIGRGLIRLVEVSISLPNFQFPMKGIFRLNRFWDKVKTCVMITFASNELEIYWVVDGEGVTGGVAYSRVWNPDKTFLIRQSNIRDETKPQAKYS